MDRPTIVCLCGSGRFREEFEQAEFDATLAGKIVLTIGCNTKDIARDVDWQHVKPMLDELHLRKIDMADEVLVINPGGYIGESTSREIAYANKLGKPIKYTHQVIAPNPEASGEVSDGFCDQCNERPATHTESHNSHGIMSLCDECHPLESTPEPSSILRNTGDKT